MLSEFPLCSYPSTVPVKIIFLRDAEPQHHWCFPFAVDGNPEPTIRWLYNGSTLNESRYTYTQLIPDSDDGSVKHGCLFLNKPTHINNGHYTLIVENKLGSDRETATGKFMDNPFDLFDSPEGMFPGEHVAIRISFLFSIGNSDYWKFKS